MPVFRKFDDAMLATVRRVLMAVWNETDNTDDVASHLQWVAGVVGLSEPLDLE
jgi:hypothetical protein